MKGRKNASNVECGSEEQPIEVSDESREVEEEEEEVELLEVLDEYPLAAIYPDRPFPTTQREKEKAELEAAKIYFNRQMKEDPDWNEEEFYGSGGYRPAKKDHPGYSEEAVEELSPLDHMDIPVPGWKELEEGGTSDQKGKSPVLEGGYGISQNRLLYFSNKKGPTQRKWEGKIPPWMQAGAKDSDDEDDNDDDEDEDEED